jgi:hypothetical protein
MAIAQLARITISHLIAYSMLTMYTTMIHAVGAD